MLKKSKGQTYYYSYGGDTRKQQEQRQDIVKELQQDALLMNTIASDSRVDRKRRIREFELQKSERETYEDYVKVPRRLI